MGDALGTGDERTESALGALAQVLDDVMRDERRGFVVCTPSGVAVVVSSVAREIEPAVLGGPLVEGDQVPAALRALVTDPTHRGRVVVVGPRSLVVASRRDRDSCVVVLLHEVAPAAESSSQTDLTEREREVLSLVAAGGTTVEVARSLGCSVRTVDKHLEHIRTKIGVHTRTAAIAWWLRR